MKVLNMAVLIALAATFQNCSSGFKGALGADVSSSSSSSSSTASSPSPAPAPLPQPTVAMPAPIANLNYKMTFNDEFTSASDVTASSKYDGVAKWYNGTEQCCMDDESGKLPAVNYPSVLNGKSVNPYSFVPGGGLNITLSKQNNGWYSGVMTSLDSAGKGFSQQYGYFEIKAKLPGTPGSWPAFWMLNTANMLTGKADGEIDIFEQYNTFINQFCTTFHDWANGKTPYYNCNMNAPGETTGFHRWGLLWTATSMSIYYDDVLLDTTPTPAVMKQPYYMLVDMGLGGGWPTSATPNTNTMQIEYVRAYAAK